jgi:hypothetical protein
MTGPLRHLQEQSQQTVHGKMGIDVFKGML